MENIRRFRKSRSAGATFSLKSAGIAGRPMAIVLIIIAIGFITVSCEKKVKEYYPSGKLMSEKTMRGDKLYGIFRMYYESGQIKQEVNYRNDLVEGVMKRWYANGISESVETYEGGMKQGQCRYFDPEGNLTDEKNYTRDTLNGPCYSWYPSGISRIQGSYAMGMYHGKWSYFSETGARVGEGNFVKGTGVLIGFDPMGRKNHQVSYINNRKDGEEVSYSGDGSVTETRVFRADSLVSVTSRK